MSEGSVTTVSGTTVPGTNMPGTGAGGPLDEARLTELASRITLNDPNSIIRFGQEAQNRAAAAADAMLGAVRNEATGEAGDALSGLLSTLRGFDVTKLDEQPNFLARWFTKNGAQVAGILQRYEGVRGQIETIGDKLDTHRTKLLEDVERLNRLYDATLEWFHALAEHIAAGERVLFRTDTDAIPVAERAAENPNDPLAPQKLRDLRAAREDLDRRLHDLRLTRQVAMQALPSIRLIQENDKALAAKIHSVLANTVPLWRTQLAQALAIQRMRDSAAAVKAATDLTNQLLTANAEGLRRANVEARTELERGVVDVEAVQKANAALVATLEDSLRIAQEGRERRVAAVKALGQAEADIRRVLIAARPEPARTK